MSPGRLDQEPAHGRARLVAQADGYADYVAQGRVPGHHRSRRGQQRGAQASGLGSGGRPQQPGAWRSAGPASHQRSIRSAISILLIVPLLSLVALYIYSAYATVGEAIARQDETTLNNDLGLPIEGLSTALSAERTDALLYLANPRALMAVPGHAATPLATLQAAETATDAAAAAFGTANAKASGLEQSYEKPLAANVAAQLDTLPAIRQKIMTGKIPLLQAFGDYNAIINTEPPFGLALADPGAPLLLFAQANAVLEEGEAAGSISEQATLVAAFAAAGTMTPQDHLVFAQIVADEKQAEAAGTPAIDWQESPDPYPAFWNTALFRSFAKVQTAIDSAGPGPLPAADLLGWQQVSTPVLEQEAAVENQARVGITASQTHQGKVILLQLVLVGGIGLAAVAISTWLLLRFGNRITRELTGLRGAARTLAGERLPGVVARLRAGEDLDVNAEAPPLALRTRTREVTETAEAFSAVQHTAVQTAVDQAALRKSVANVFRSLARRNQSLLQRQLKMLDGMERDTHDPDRLSQLFQLDHLTTRMRRQAEGLIILSGAAPGRGWRQPVPVVEVLRGAISEIEDYARVDLLTDSPDFVEGTGVADVTHLLAEMIENAVMYSPPNARVQVSGSRAASGYVVEIEDRGLGIPPGDRATLNERLASPPEFDLADSDQLGLFVVSRLASRYGIRVSLRESGYGGTTAIVLLPASLVVSEDQIAMQSRQGHPPTPNGPGRSAIVAGSAADALTGRRSGADSKPVPLPGGPGGPGAPREFGGSEGWGGSRGGFADARGGGPGTQPPASTAGGLPRRAKMASLAPQLREDRPNTPRGPLSDKSPEQARALLSSIQKGLRTGRDTAVGDDSVSGGDAR